MKLRKVTILLIIGLFITQNVLHAQLPGMKVYTQLDGFPGTVGYIINQDAKGFMWIGTDNGTAWFDGKKFNVIDDKQGLTDKEILTALPYGEQHVLNIPLLNNISYWKNGKIITGAQNKTLNIVSNTIHNFGLKDKITQKVWIGDGVNYNYLYSIDGDTLKKVKIDSIPPFSLSGATNNTLYLMIYNDKKISGVNFIKYNLNKNIYSSFELDDERVENYFSSNNVVRVKVSDDGKYAIFMLGYDGYEVFEIRGNKLYSISKIFPSGTARHISIDRNNHLWVALNSGVEYWGHLGELKQKNQPITLMKDISINDIFVDRDNNVWFTTEQKGLYFISSRHWANAKLIQKLKLPQYAAKSVTGDNKNTIIIGHSGKPAFTYIYDGKAKEYTIPNGTPLGVRQVIIKDSLIFLVTNFLAQYKIKENNLYFKDIHNGRSIKDIEVYNDYLLMAENSMLEIIKIGNKNYVVESPKVLFNRRTTAIAVLPDSSLLIGTPNGLYKKKTLFAKAVKIKKDVLALANITDIKWGRGQCILVGTNAQGLYNYNYVTGNISSVDFEGNKMAGYIRDVYRQNDSIFWVSTDKGVKRINFNSSMTIESVSNYTFFDGLPSSNAYAVYVHNDTAYVATDAGIGLLPLNAQLHKLVAPELWINSLRFDDSLVLFPKNKIDLSYKQNNISLSFSAIAYENIGNIKYKYRLNGLSDQWIETESPEISFSGLSPGEYQLEAYAANVNGKLSAKPLLMAIIVHPAFWQTGWFKGAIYLLIIALVILCIYWFVITGKNKQYNKIQQSRKLAELELEAIKAQINPHFIFNCLNSIQAFSYKNEHELVKEYIRFFARLIRQTMDYSQETFITLSEEVNYLENYLKLEKIRFKGKLEYSIEINDSLDKSRLLPAMLIQPYVENALKHSITNEGICMVQISFEDIGEGNLCITIKDNGPGINFEKNKQSNNTLGMRLSGSRVSTYNQLFNIGIKLQIQPNIDDKASANGTVISLIIPVITHDIKQL